MARDPLDTLEYESTYLELRPETERLRATRDVLILFNRDDDGQLDEAVALDRMPAADTATAALTTHATPSLPADRHRREGPAPGHAVHRSGWPATLPAITTTRRHPRVPLGRLPSRRRRRSRTLVRVTVALSTSLGLVATFDAGAAQAVFVVVTGVLVLGWARLAWHGTSRPEPFGASTTRVVDRSLTALGTFFAIALWANYAPQASAGISRTVVLVLCGVGLVSGLLAGSRTLHP